MNAGLFDDVDEIELIEFGIPRAIYTRANHYNNMSNHTFFKRFRLTKETVMILLPLLEDQLEFPFDVNQCVSPINKLLTTLRYFATGAHIDSIADFMGIHQTTAIRIIHKVTRATASLYGRFVKFPSTEAEQRIFKRDFYDIARFPNVIGALGCTHIRIKSPGGRDSAIFRNRKDYFSTNVQTICDTNNKFLDVVARWSGASHDSTIFNNSVEKTLFEGGRFPKSILLGDRGYPLKNYLLTPLLNPTTPAEQLYNQSHIRTRNKIECTFGILKRRFPVLAYGCRVKIENVLIVIVAAMVLYNIAQIQNEAEPNIEKDMNAEELNQLNEGGQIRNSGNHEANVGYNRRRTQLINEYLSRL
nr:unnamed protein product [Callosobruchus analis]